MNHNLSLVIRREYLFRVRKKSFLLLTLLTPLLMIGMIFVPLWLASFRADEVRTVAVIDHTGHYAPLFTDTDGYRFVTTRTDDPFATLEVCHAEEARRQLRRAVPLPCRQEPLVLRLARQKPLQMLRLWRGRLTRLLHYEARTAELSRRPPLPGPEVSH